MTSQKDLFTWELETHAHGHIPEEVVPAEEFRFPGEALVLQRGSAVETAYALDVPCTVQNV